MHYNGLRRSEATRVDTNGLPGEHEFEEIRANLTDYSIITKLESTNGPPQGPKEFIGYINDSPSNQKKVSYRLGAMHWSATADSRREYLPWGRNISAPSGKGKAEGGLVYSD